MPDTKDVDENKVIAALSYVWILFLIPLLTKKSSPYAMFHCKQGIVFFVVSTIVGFISWIPVIGWLLALAVFILFILGLINALSGKTEPLPVIGQFAEKIKL